MIGVGVVFGNVEVLDIYFIGTILRNSTQDVQAYNNCITIKIMFWMWNCSMNLTISFTNFFITDYNHPWSKPATQRMVSGSHGCWDLSMPDLLGISWFCHFFNFLPAILLSEGLNSCLRSKNAPFCSQFCASFFHFNAQGLSYVLKAPKYKNLPSTSCGVLRHVPRHVTGVAKREK